MVRGVFEDDSGNILTAVVSGEGPGFLKSVGCLFFGKSDSKPCDLRVMVTHERPKLKIGLN